MDSETKYNVASCLVVMSIVSCSMSLIALYIAIPQIPKNTYDYNGALVTILSVLVTVLLGWNIYTLIDIKSLSKNLDKVEENILRQVDYKINSFNSNSAKDMGVITSVTMAVSSPKENGTDTLKTIITMYQEVMNNEKSFAFKYCLDVIGCIIENDNIYYKIDKKRLLINISMETLKNLQIHTIKYFTNHKKMVERVSELLFIKIDK